MTKEPRPVISGFHPDPSVLRSSDGYYLVTSSFEYFPGVPLFHSTNLRDWTQVGHVLDRPAQLDVSTAKPSGGIFAPTIREHNGTFWMITTNVSDGNGQLLVSAADPRGPWSDPVRIPGIDGIDPDLAWDDAGRTLVTFASFDATTTTSIIRQVEIDPVSGAVLSEPVDLWQGTGHKFPEGPHLYRVDGFWYLMLAEGGTERGHSVVIARGPTPQGPFEAAPTGPILTRRGMGGTLQNTGHADLVQRPDGSWAIVFLGVRVRGGSPQFHVLGRETFAAELSWQDGWPVVGELLEPSSPATGPDSVTEHSYDFSKILGPAWAGSGPHASDAILAVGDSSLVLAGSRESDGFLGRRQEHLYAEAQVTIEPTDGHGSLVLRIDPSHEYAISVSPRRIRVISQVGAVRAAIVERSLPAPPLSAARTVEKTTVYITVKPAASIPGAPDCVCLGYIVDGVRTQLARLDGRYLSTEVASGFTGRFFGIVAANGRPSFSRFRYRGSDDPQALLG
ncbi:MAG: family 43 glycosylhydrolase [Glaciihabitans sp.]